MRLFVSGCIEVGGSIEAGEFIEAGGSIEAGWSIKAGEFIKAGWSIKAGGSIEAGEFIKAGWSIKAGESYGIIAGLSITCKGKLSFGLKAFAGICNWREITDEDKTITCGELESGTIEYGILKETGIEESDDKTQEAMRLLKEKGYKIVKI
jgi:UDP-3-O-[3-hydroxymyristoyl] glucosamine N-acyltransferase